MKNMSAEEKLLENIAESINYDKERKAKRYERDQKYRKQDFDRKEAKRNRSSRSHDWAY